MSHTRRWRDEASKEGTVKIGDRVRYRNARELAGVVEFVTDAMEAFFRDANGVQRCSYTDSLEVMPNTVTVAGVEYEVLGEPRHLQPGEIGYELYMVNKYIVEAGDVIFGPYIPVRRVS
jgi:hypothetical protein